MTMTVTLPAKRIEAGNALTARSLCDHNCVFTAYVIERKGQFATVTCLGRTRRVKIYSDDRGEHIYATGRYSMAPVFRP